MIIVPLSTNKKLKNTISIPVANPPGSKGLTLAYVTKKTKGVKSKTIIPAQNHFLLFFPAILNAIKFVIPKTMKDIKRIIIPI